MLKNRFFRVSSKGIVIYNEKYYGSKASFNSYLEGLDNFALKDDETTPPPFEDLSPKNSALEILQELGKENNLEKFLEAHGLSEVSVPHLKESFKRLLKTDYKRKEISKWEEQLKNLKELRDGKKLEKWLESIGAPASKVSLPLAKKELEKYFQNYKSPKENAISKVIQEPNWGKRENKKLKSPKAISSSAEELCRTLSKDQVYNLHRQKSLDEKSEKVSCAKKTKRDFGPCMRIEDFKGRSIIYHENSLANKLWEEFKGMNAAKQVAIVVGITVITAALGFVSWRILFLTFPSVFNANSYWVEVLSQWFIQRQESTFHLLQHTAQNSKPLSTAWANQYLLWKYI